MIEKSVFAVGEILKIENFIIKLLIKTCDFRMKTERKIKRKEHNCLKFMHLKFKCTLK